MLCNSLLKQLDNDTYEPKNIKREKVKGVLLSFRRNLQEVGSECRECGMTHLTIFNSSETQHLTRSEVER